MVAERTAVAITEAADSILKVQGLLANGINGMNVADSLENFTHMAELRIFAAAFYENDPELNSAEHKAAKIMEKVATAAKLLREVECEIDRLHASCLAVK